MNLRKAEHIDLIEFCFLSKKDDFMEVTEWTNGDGYDIAINDKLFQLTNGQLDALNYLVLKLNKREV